MKHKWKLLTPASGPLVAVSDIKTPFRYTVDWRLLCSRCGEDLTVPYDVLDTDNIIKFCEEQQKRNDCPGKTK